MSTPEKKVVTRFAPSPTGFMHVGGVRTALFAWLFARKSAGTFILRIEDTDKIREVDGSADHIIESLRWLGIEWDEGIDIGGPNAPYLQSERLDSYMKYAEQLIAKGFAYPDPYTEEEVEVFRKQAEEEKRPFLFRDHRPEILGVWDKKKPLRFKVPTIKRYEWHDEVYGDLSAGEEALDDFILIKGDGYPTYNLAHIIDDLEMGVTHVLRANEFISSTPKFLSLYEALGIVPPIFATLPPIMAPDGKKKLGKRDGAKDLLEYRTEGYLPEAMMNFLAFIGWNPGTEQELFSKDELISRFELSRIQKAGGKFNDEKLDWYNKEYLKKLSLEEQVGYLEKYLPEKYKTTPLHSKTFMGKLAPVLLDHMVKGADLAIMDAAGELAYFFNAPTLDISKLVWKDSTKEDAQMHLSKVKTLLENTGEDMFTPENIKSVIWPYAEESGRGAVLWPLRFALSGREKSPDPFTLLSLLGKKESLARIEHALDLLS